MGILHNTALMWIDAHKGQFGWNEDYRGMVVFDLEPGTCCWLLYRALTAAQAATTLVPLLSNFDPPEFEAFILNYLDKRGDAGMDVFNYIVNGDHTGWKRAFDCGDYDAVVNRILAQRDEDPEQELASNLCSLLGMSYSRLGRHDEARAVYQETLARLDPADPEVSSLRFGLGRAYYRAGQPERAAAEFRETIRLEQLNPTFPTMLDDARSMLAKC